MILIVPVLPVTFVYEYKHPAGAKTMDVLEQVDKLLTDIERVEKKRMSEQELNMAILLLDASRQYVQYLKERQLQSARDRLVDICRLVHSMIDRLPTE